MRTDMASMGGELGEALRACRLHLFAAGTFSFALNLLYLTVPLYSLQVYDRILPSGSDATLALITLAVLVALAALAALDALRARVLARAGVRIERMLGARAMQASLERALALGPRERGQGLRELERLRLVFSGAGVLAVFDAPWFPVYLVALFLLHWILGALALGIGLVLLVLALLNYRAALGPVASVQQVSAQSYELTEAALRGAEVVRAMDMGEALLARWARDRVALVRAQLDAGDRAALFSSTIRFVRIVAQVFILGAAAFLAIRQMISPGAIFAATMLLARAIQPVEQLVGAWRELAAARGAYQRLGALLAQTHGAIPRVELPRPAGRLTVINAGFMPPGGSRPALQGIGFSLAPGEVLGIVGPTAAGKSTLARLIAGICPPNTGEVRIDGENAFTWARGGLGRHLGYLPQDVQLLPGTVAENIARFREAPDDAIIEAARAAGAHEQILALPRGYATRIQEYGPALSGGQRQLVGLARALYGNPSLVILDEPNANLDSAAEARLLESLQRLKEGSATVVVVTHRVGALAAADRILLLQDGRQVAYGPSAEILARLAGPVAATPLQRARGA